MTPIPKIQWISWEQSLDYDESVSDDDYNAVVEEMRAKGYRFCGYCHQNGDKCIPLVDGKRAVNLSLRAWGGLMADVMGLPVDNAYRYLEWAHKAPHGVEEVSPE